MIEWLAEVDRELFILLNSFHAPWLDHLMFALTHTQYWIPLYIFFVYLIIKQFGKNSWIFLIGIGLTVLVADQFTAAVMKPYFGRLRPSHEPALKALVHLVNDYIGGKFGFASSHAANTFGAATYLFLVLRKAYKRIALIFFWAVFVSYTRIYLGVHYPGDILAGALLGAGIGIVFYNLARMVYDKWMERRTDTAID